LLLQAVADCRELDLARSPASLPVSARFFVIPGGEPCLLRPDVKSIS